FVTLDRLLARLHANKAELLKVIERPDIPLHTNGSENDIRCHVTRRKVSGGTRSDLGRDARDTFLALAKTCAKLGISFWNYLPRPPPQSPRRSPPAPSRPPPRQDPPALTATTFAPLPEIYAKSLILMVGAPRFELGTPSPPDWCANRAALRSEWRGL